MDSWSLSRFIYVWPYSSGASLNGMKYREFPQVHVKVHIVQEKMHCYTSGIVLSTE